MSGHRLAHGCRIGKREGDKSGQALAGQARREERQVRQRLVRGAGQEPLQSGSWRRRGERSQQPCSVDHAQQTCAARQSELIHGKTAVVMTWSECCSCSCHSSRRDAGSCEKQVGSRSAEATISEGLPINSVRAAGGGGGGRREKKSCSED